MIILIHTSKTMRPPATNAESLQKPMLLDQTKALQHHVQALSPSEIANVMHVSPKLAKSTHELIAGWNDKTINQRVAIDSFLGDIYSGLQVQTWTNKDRQYADKTLRILSGLYGILRPLDGIYPYRFEMGYKLPGTEFNNLYTYWGDSIAKTLPSNALIINLAAIEYSKVITPYVDASNVITPSFLTINPKTKEPAFIVVHTKIARGAFASWLITHQIEDTAKLSEFKELGYEYSEELSSPNEPVFICKSFGGIGLSVRLT